MWPPEPAITSQNGLKKNGLPRRCAPRNDSPSNDSSTIPRTHSASASEASGAEREAGSITTSARWLMVFLFDAPCAAKRPHGSQPHTAPHPGRDRARPLPSYRKYSKNSTPVPPRDGIQRKGPQALPLVVSRGSRGEIPKSPRESFFGGLGVYSFDSKRIHPRMPPSILGTPGWSTGHRRRGVVTPPYEAPGEPPRPRHGAKSRRASPAEPYSLLAAVR